MDELDPIASAEEPISLNGHHDSSTRERILWCLRQIPQLVDALKKFSPSDAFRVVMSEKNAKFFRQASDGFYKPFLHDGEKFVENVNLKRLPPDFLGAISNVMLIANMAAIAADLSAIKIAVGDIGKLLSNTIRGAVKGAISAIGQAKALTDQGERRREALGACRDLSVQLGMLAGQLKAHCSAMPEPKTGILDGMFGPSLAEAEAKWQEVAFDLILLREGLATLLGTYGDLGEPAAARAALADILRSLHDADLPDAARKARLVPFPHEGLPPENLIKKFIQIAANVENRLLLHEASHLLPVMMDINAEELQ